MINRTNVFFISFLGFLWAIVAWQGFDPGMSVITGFISLFLVLTWIHFRVLDQEDVRADHEEISHDRYEALYELSLKSKEGERILAHAVGAGPISNAAFRDLSAKMKEHADREARLRMLEVLRPVE